jgi:FkbM family methyltransferase
MLPARLSDKPQYIFHPVRLAKRVLHSTGPTRAASHSTAVAQLPWGLPLEVDSREAIGYTILTARIFDPCVTETLHRLIDPGDLVLDVGANVGYLTGLAAVRAEAEGRVIAFEPHPRVFELLQANVRRWRERPELASVEPQQAAASDHSGTAELQSGPLFHVNMGLASLADHGSETIPSDVDLIQVDVHRLDDVIGDRRVGLLKVDVEGHEPAVLAGASRLLGAGQIRDVVFEDHEPYPDPCTELLEQAGYQLFALENDLFGLRLVPPPQRRAQSRWPGPSYLATRDPDRALKRLTPRGWRVPGIGPSLPRRRRRRSP